MTEHEEFLTLDDSKQIITKEIDGRVVKEVIDLGLDIDEIRRINNHPVENIARTNSTDLLNYAFDEEIKIKNIDGKNIYINCDNSEMYRRHENNSLLESTPESERYYLTKTTLVVSVKGEKFKKGFTETESIIKRVLDKDGKWPTENGMKRYMALTDMPFAFEYKGQTRRMRFDEGEVFLAPQKCEDKEKKKTMLK